VIAEQLPATTADAAVDPVMVHDGQSGNTSPDVLPTAPISHSTPVEPFVPLFDDVPGSQPMAPITPPPKGKRTRPPPVPKGKVSWCILY
jgi:hypothetical protein